MGLQWDANRVPLGFQWDANGLQIRFRWDANGIQIGFRFWIPRGFHVASIWGSDLIQI